MKIVQVVVVLAAGVTACGGGSAPSSAPSVPASAPALDCATPDPKLREATPPEARHFTPITDAEVEGLVGKQVYPGSPDIRAGNSKLEVVAGEPLTLCRIVTAPAPVKEDPSPGRVVRTRDFGGPSNHAADAKFYLVTVKTGSGQVGDAVLTGLSSTPLKYDLRHPGKAPELLQNGIDEAKGAAHAIFALQQQAGFDVWYDHDKDIERRRNYDRLSSLSKSLVASRMMVHNLVYGGEQKESLLRRKAWPATAEDNQILEWWSHGMDGDLKKKNIPIDACLSHLEQVPGSAQRIADAEAKKRDKPWRKKMNGVDESKLASLDTDNNAKLDTEIANAKKTLDEIFSDPRCEQQP